MAMDLRLSATDELGSYLINQWYAKRYMTLSLQRVPHDIHTTIRSSIRLDETQDRILLGLCVLMLTLVKFLPSGMKDFSLTQVNVPPAFTCPVFNPP